MSRSNSSSASAIWLISEMSKKFSGGLRISIRPTCPIFSTPMSLVVLMRSSIQSTGISASQSARLAQTKPARDDAAQHFGGAALNGEFWRGLHRERQLVLQRFVIAGVSIDEGGEVANPVRQLLFPDRADVLDDRGFHHRLPAGLQHARHRHRHPPHGVKLRDEPPDAFGGTRIGRAR